MGRSSKKKYRDHADVAACYGGSVLGDQPAKEYELFCGLVFNGERSEIRQANVVREGIGAAFSDKLSLVWHKALANSEDEAIAAFNVQLRRLRELTEDEQRKLSEDEIAEAELAEIERMEREAAESGNVETQSTTG